jgi:hypothetical protein
MLTPGGEIGKNGESLPLSQEGIPERVSKSKSFQYVSEE